MPSSWSSLQTHTHRERDGRKGERERERERERENPFSSEDLIPILLKLFYKRETEITLLNSFYEATVKPHKNSTKKENFRSISL